jgi:superfamily I DNA and/or RNA helicase
MLAWHYRSRHPSLIALSNEECYGGRLLLPPSPYLKTTEFGLRLVETPRGFYDRGGTARDLVQAEQVAEAIAQHMETNANKSLGVACLSAQQRDAVDDMIDKLGFRAGVEAFSPNDERLFVKNLEAVQGDERDVIFISVGYGVAPEQSRPFLNFGPVSRDGGERRLTSSPHELAKNVSSSPRLRQRISPLTRPLGERGCSATCFILLRRESWERGRQWANSTVLLKLRSQGS